MDIKPQETSVSATNPLIKHFRRPAIYFKLPSNGQFWPENSLDLPVTGEIPVFPMTSADEITLKTPDALMNGSGVVGVIQSCCPNIRDAWKMPSIDVDATLIAIRIASYGNQMGIMTTCPHCKEEHEYDIDLGRINEGIRAPDYTQPIDYDGLKIKLWPQKYFGVTRNNLVQYEEQRIVQTLQDDKIEQAVKDATIKESMRRLLDINTQMMVDSTEYIETEDGQRVREPQHIKEFYQNAENRVTKEIERRLAELAKQAELPKTPVECQSCKQPYDITMEFDYARFFALGS